MAKDAFGVTKETAEKMPEPKAKGKPAAWESYTVRRAKNGGVIVSVQRKSDGKGMIGADETHAFTSLEEADDFMDGLLGHED